MTEPPGPQPSQAVGDPGDELALIFMCCHPALDPATQVALTLRCVCGLSTAQIAAAFLVCLDQPIDTTSPQGKLFFTILAAFAEFERDLIRERTKDGLAATTACSRNGGRKHRLTPEQVQAAKDLRAAGHTASASPWK